jgi:hypothetical protein
MGGDSRAISSGRLEADGGADLHARVFTIFINRLIMAVPTTRAIVPAVCCVCCVAFQVGRRMRPLSRPHASGLLQAPTLTPAAATAPYPPTHPHTHTHTPKQAVALLRHRGSEHGRSRRGVLLRRHGALRLCQPPRRRHDRQGACALCVCVCVRARARVCVGVRALCVERCGDHAVPTMSLPLFMLIRFAELTAAVPRRTALVG